MISLPALDRDTAELRLSASNAAGVDYLLSGKSALILTALVLIFSGPAEGAKIADASLLPASHALGETVNNVVWFEASFNGSPYHASGILVRGVEADWVITAGHLLSTPTWTVDISTIIIGDGTSYITNRGNMSAVSALIQDYNPSIGHSGPPDMGFLRLANRISVPGQYFNIAATPGLTQPITFASYGVPKSFLEGDLPIDGHVMGVTSKFSTAEPSGYTASLYDSGSYDPGDPASGIGTSGDSGGFVGVWNPARFNPMTGAMGDYDTLGMSVAANSGATYFMSFNEPGVKARILQVTQPMQAPVPVPLLGLQLSPTGTAMRLTWDAVATGYRLQTSDDLSTWTDLGSVLTGPGTYDAPIANRPRKFYRLTKP